MWLSVQMTGLTKLFQKRFNPSNERRVAHYEKPFKKERGRGKKLDFRQANASTVSEGFARLIITNMKLELVFYRPLFPSNYISFSFHFIPLFFFSYLLLIFYFILHRSLEWYVWSEPSSAWWGKAWWSRKNRSSSKKKGLRLDWESICTVINVLLCFVKDAWPFQYYISCSDENGIWNIIVKNGWIGIIMTQRLSKQKTQQDPIVKEVDTEPSS